MKTINANTKRGQNFINAYNRSNYTSIYQCYTNPSWNKARAEYMCSEMMIKEGGNDYRVLSFNTFQFSCGWCTSEGLRVETAAGSYLIK